MVIFSILCTCHMPHHRLVLHFSYLHIFHSTLNNYLTEHNYFLNILKNPLYMSTLNSAFDFKVICHLSLVASDHKSLALSKTVDFVTEFTLKIIQFILRFRINAKLIPPCIHLYLPDFVVNTVTFKHYSTPF